MPPMITDVAFRVSLITETLAGHSDWSRQLANFGVSTAVLEKGQKVLVAALEKMDTVAQHADDHTAVEQARRAVTEVYAWHETHELAWRRVLGDLVDEATWKAIRGDELAGHDAEYRALLRGWRMLSAIRTLEAHHEALQDARPRLVDELQRGYVLVSKAVRLLNVQVDLKADERRENIGRPELELAARNLHGWLLEVAAAAHKAFASEIFKLGMLGIAPDDVGLPVGGMARDVILHEVAKGKAPESKAAEPCEQWGVGASGNRENYWS